MIKKIIFKKVTFFNIKDNEISSLFNIDGLFVFPSGPNLSEMRIGSEYHLSLKKADYVFFDSGFFVLLLKLFKGISVNKVSGYKFLNHFFRYISKNKNKSIFCIDPDIKTSNINKKFLNKFGVRNVYSYVAPIYNEYNFNDKKLLKLTSLKKADYILTNIGGGKQEVLGHYLKKNLKYKTSIFCTGGAISYFTGHQAPINNFFDKFYLGWLIRILFNPRIFLIRYLKSFKLLFVIIFSNIRVLKK